MANLKNPDLIVLLQKILLQHSFNKIAVGLSGGMDSVALLHAIFLLKHPQVLAIHIHHGISKNADSWLEFSQNFAKARGFDFAFEKVRLPNYSENAARAARFQVFEKIAGENPLFLAQHANDQMETILFKMARGGGLAAMRGIKKINKINSLTIIRPWLTVPRNKILAFAQAHNLHWVEDDSNVDCRYSRNFLRHQVILPFQKRFPAVVAHFAQSSEIADEALALLNDLAKMDFARAALSQNALSVAQIRSLSFYRLKNLLRFILEESGVLMPPQRQFLEFVRQIMESQKSPRLDLPNFSMFIQNGQLKWQKSTVNV